MKVKELKQLLNDFDEELEIVIGDYDMIANEEETVFHDIDGLEQLTSTIKKEEFVSIHY
jgi:hypothetical protein